MYWLINYLIEIIKLSLGVIGISSVKVVSKKIYTVANIACLCGILLLVASNTVSSNMFALVPIIGCMAIIMSLKDKNKFNIVFLWVVIIGLADNIIGGVIGLFVKFDISEMLSNNPLMLYINSINIFIMLIIIYVKKIGNNKNKIANYISNNLTTRYVIFIFLSVVGLAMYLIPIQILALMDGNERLKEYSLIGVALSGVIFSVISFANIVIYKSKSYYKKGFEIYNKLIAQQKDYYKTLLEKEIATKRFRHDIANHLYCIKRLEEKGNDKEVLEYINNMLEVINGTKNTIYHYSTGNEILDIVLDDILRDYPDIELECKGLFPNNVMLSDMEICILFSNIFKNAVRATGKCDVDKQKICAQFKSLGNNLWIKVINPVVSDVIIENNKLKTDKSNKEYHGMGSKNIEEVVKKYKGEVYYRSENNTFTIEIVMERVINIL